MVPEPFPIQTAARLVLAKMLDMRLTWSFFAATSLWKMHRKSIHLTRDNQAHVLGSRREILKRFREARCNWALDFPVTRG